jgi:hypothetical protein
MDVAGLRKVFPRGSLKGRAGTARCVAKLTPKRQWSCVLAICLVGLCACWRLVDPQLPPGSRQFSPPVVYVKWWAMTEACSGRFASIESLSWFQVPGTLRDPTNGEDLGGYWSGGSNRIVLAEENKLSGEIVRHEMLHALLQKPTHPRAAFLGNCAGVVDCVQKCIADAGPPPILAPDAVEVPPDSLEISLEVEPLAPTIRQDDGAFTITVSAHNPSSHPVVVRLPQRVGAPSRTFWFDVRAPSGGVTDGDLELDPSVTMFSPGETKRRVFDFTIGNDLASRALPPGTYTVVRGAYGDHWAAHDPIVVQR